MIIIETIDVAVADPPPLPPPLVVEDRDTDMGDPADFSVTAEDAEIGLRRPDLLLILGKMGMENASELIRYAVAHHLVDADDFR